MAHNNERPKIFKPKLCTDCHDEKPTQSTGHVNSTASHKINNGDDVTETVEPMKRLALTYDKSHENDEFNKTQNTQKQNGQENISMQNDSAALRPKTTSEEVGVWPPWSSRPPMLLGEFVR